MSSCTVSPAARADLRSIWHYTVDTWNEDQADCYVAMITSLFERLASGELRGRSADEFRRGYLRVSAGSHYVFYKLSKRHGDITVMRILHQRMNLAARLRDRK